MASPCIKWMASMAGQQSHDDMHTYLAILESVLHCGGAGLPAAPGHGHELAGQARPRAEHVLYLRLVRAAVLGALLRAKHVWAPRICSKS